ncbi:MAG: hypothetical protein IPP60_04685 [Sphingobacteriales bacterium]|nr:hypothetical protein [Sphingobacteriales bacterium]
MEKIIFRNRLGVQLKGSNRATPLAPLPPTPPFSNAKIVFPRQILEYMDETKSYIFVSYSKYGFLNKTIFIDKKTGKEINVSAINGFDRYSIWTMGTKTDECVLYNEPVNKPKSGFLLNIADNKLSNNDFWATHGQTFVDGSDDIITELIEVPSYVEHL